MKNQDNTGDKAEECGPVHHWLDPRQMKCRCGLLTTVPFFARSASLGSQEDAAPPQRPIKQLRDVLSMLCHFVWYRQTRPGEHMWSIPVDKERDFDCILSDAIDELERLRALPRTASSLLAAPEGRLRELVQLWRGSADWMMGSTKPSDWQRGGAGYLKQCADELEAALAPLAEPPA